MCRIFGYFGPKNISEKVLRDVSNLQLKGGPDQQSIFKTDGWAIGNNRLSIIDLDGGEQPYHLGEHISVVFNGEIYNHVELREKLVKKGYLFKDNCDGSILPAMYYEFGQDFVSYLDGMFAIAVVDTRNGNASLLLANDSVGIKSLYYYWDDKKETLYFSSELPSLLGFNEIPKNLWLKGVDSYLTTKAIFGETTMFENIYNMPPSTMLLVNPGKRPQLKKWNTSILSKRIDRRNESPSETLISYLKNEVISLLQADVPVATINSGGLDSSLITALASLQKEGIHSFNIAYKGNWPFDEKAYAKEVANQYHTSHHQIIIDPKEFHNILPKVVRHLGQPNADPIALSTYSLFESINQAGFKVALSGDGADEMFGGYDRYKEALNPSKDWIAPYIDSLGAINQKGRQEIYSEDYLALIKEQGSVAAEITEKLQYTESSRLDTIMNFERDYRLPNYHLRRVDHLSMAHSVEVRVPYCQPRVVDFSKQLTDEERIQENKVKRILYNSASGLLPNSIMNRKKQPFTLPINEMMRPGLPLYDFIKNTLDYGTISKNNIFNFKKIEKLLHLQGTNPSDKTALALWSIMIFQLWIEQYQVSIGSSKSIQGGILL